jgi:hypothetical protein
MEGMSLLHWAIVFVEVCIIWLIVGFPVARIMRRIGYSGWWSILVFVPVANLIGLWTLAFARWPTVKTAAPTPLSR